MNRCRKLSGIGSIERRKRNKNKHKKAAPTYIGAAFKLLPTIRFMVELWCTSTNKILYMSIVLHDYNGFAISQDEDRYVSLTDMAKAAGKQVGHYLRLDSTNEYLEALSTEIQIGRSSLVKAFKGGSGKQGTWAHPEVAIDFAQWCNVSFRIWANRTLKGAIEKKSEAAQLEILNQTIALREIELEALKIEKGIIAPARTKTYKVIDLTGIDNIESVEAYIRDRVKLDPSCKIYVGNKDGNPTKLFYPNYLLYCKQHNFESVSVQRFSRVFMQLIYATSGTKLFKGKDSKGCHIKGAKFLLYCE
jgi:hypothetical protein